MGRRYPLLFLLFWSSLLFLCGVFLLLFSLSQGPRAKGVMRSDGVLELETHTHTHTHTQTKSHDTHLHIRDDDDRRQLRPKYLTFCFSFPVGSCQVLLDDYLPFVLPFGSTLYFYIHDFLACSFWILSSARFCTAFLVAYCFYTYLFCTASTIHLLVLLASGGKGNKATGHYL